VLLYVPLLLRVPQTQMLLLLLLVLLVLLNIEIAAAIAGAIVAGTSIKTFTRNVALHPHHCPLLLVAQAAQSQISIARRACHGMILLSAICS